MGLVKSEGGTGALVRGLRLGKLGLGLTGSYLGYQVQNLFLGEEKRAERGKSMRRAASRRIRGELGELKGPMMKFGQILSMQTHLLPRETIEELATLQTRAPAMHPSLARARFKSSCGKYPEELFAEFDAEPFAAASLGQVHRAITRTGEKVAVKIQYPAIRAAIENDFKLLRSATFPVRLTGHVPVEILNEVQRGFLEETDYLHEAKSMDYFRERLACLPYVTVPKVHWDLTTDRVLTMSFVSGEPAGEFLLRNPSSAVRDQIGERLFELFEYQIQCLQAIHADPHPGNYLLRMDGTFGLIDFGCVKRCSMDLGELTRCAVDRSWQYDSAQAERLVFLVWCGKVSAKDPRTRRMLAYLKDFIDLVFPPSPKAAAEVDFGNPALLHSVTGKLSQAVGNKLTNPELAFVSRAELGLYNLLHQLGARVRTREILDRCVDRARGLQAG